MRKTLPLLAVLAAGMAIRLVLAYVVYPDQGFASDIQLFASWARALAAGGPATFCTSCGRWGRSAAASRKRSHNDPRIVG